MHETHSFGCSTYTLLKGNSNGTRGVTEEDEEKNIMKRKPLAVESNVRRRKKKKTKSEAEQSTEASRYIVQIIDCGAND